MVSHEAKPASSSLTTPTTATNSWQVRSPISPASTWYNDVGEHPGKQQWNRSMSAAELLHKARSPKRRYLDHVQPTQDLLSPSSSRDALQLSSQASTCDPCARRKTFQYSQRFGDSSPDSNSTFERTGLSAVSPSSTAMSSTGFVEQPHMIVPRTERAMDHWKLGESMRIMNHIEPKAFRAISKYGEVYQGIYAKDWGDVRHIQACRAKTAAGLKALLPSKGPVPQDMTSFELRKNRSFGESHGAPRNPHGFVRMGPGCLVP
eukprot:TRINITY_DN109655_c0_g1_i1.p1 TRINITY_DN109655_c0_g1~~TRINITY_DN109655_c0_g1_i1.p1  ORF type:complete len:262 (-),score=28.49 TRINITY_DN109655_c0_g1_i1:67-852(-)